MSGFKKYLSNAVWMVGGRMSKAALNFAVGIFVARYLGPERFGVLNYAIGLSLLFSVIGVMGLENVLVRDLVRNKEDERTFLGSALLLRLSGSSIAFLSTLILLWLTSADAETWVLTSICASAVFIRAFNVIRSLFEARVQAKYIAVAEWVQCLLSAGLRIYFFTVEGDVFWFSVCWLYEWLFATLGFFLFYNGKCSGIGRWRIDNDIIKHLLKESAPLLLSAMAIIVYQQIDKVMLKNLLGATGNEQVGFYSVAMRILPFVSLIPQMLGKALVPSLINAHKVDKKKYTERAQLFMDVMVLVGMGLSIFSFFAADLIILLYGREYVAAGILLKVVSWKGVLSALHVASGHMIVVEGSQKWALIRNASGMILNIGLNYFLIPIWGAFGSAWATVASLSFSSVGVNLFIPAYRNIFFAQCSAVFLGSLRLTGFFIRKLKHYLN